MQRFFCHSLHFPIAPASLSLSPSLQRVVLPLTWVLIRGQYQGGVLKVRIVVQSHLHGMSCQFKSTESKGPGRDAKLGHQIQGGKLRIKTKPQPR